MKYQDWLEEKELIKRAEIETFRELNGFSEEEDELISWKYSKNIRD